MFVRSPHVGRKTNSKFYSYTMLRHYE